MARRYGNTRLLTSAIEGAAQCLSMLMRDLVVSEVRDPPFERTNYFCEARRNIDVGTPDVAREVAREFAVRADGSGTHGAKPLLDSDCDAIQQYLGEHVERLDLEMDEAGHFAVAANRDSFL